MERVGARRAGSEHVLVRLGPAARSGAHRVRRNRIRLLPGEGHRGRGGAGAACGVRTSAGRAVGDEAFKAPKFQTYVWNYGAGTTTREERCRRGLSNTAGGSTSSFPVPLSD